MKRSPAAPPPPATGQDATPRPHHRAQYTPPAILYHAPLEVTAAVCDDGLNGKSFGEFCTGPINS
ncbi:MAG: hypothetical protein H3C34_17840 [Caldilineaceae bacterium]|nr:hypothetical protein [Caldilineaceae bacterium]